MRYFFLSLLLQLCLPPLSFQRASLPKFLIKGHLSSTNCIITQPLTGELVVENAEAAVKSIELQLVRVETCGKFLCKQNAYRLWELPLALFQLKCERLSNAIQLKEICKKLFHASDRTVQTLI